MVKKTEKKQTKRKSSNNDGNIIAGLMYVLTLLSIIGIVVNIVIWSLKRDDKLITYHFKQLIVLWVCSLIVIVLGLIPVIGWFVIWPIGGLILFVLWLLGMINAFSGKQEKIPIIGRFADEHLKF